MMYLSCKLLNMIFFYFVAEAFPEGILTFIRISSYEFLHVH
jgi:hypothetical protein